MVLRQADEDPVLNHSLMYEAKSRQQMSALSALFAIRNNDE